jgi:pyruvate formate lyase activating enzyme
MRPGAERAEDRAIARISRASIPTLRRAVAAGRLFETLLVRCRAEGITTTIETCGYAPRRAVLRVAPFTSVFLYDLKIVDERRHRAMTGVSNRPIVANLRALAGEHARIILRFPLIPGLTDDGVNVRAIGALAASLGLARVDVLPYHRAGVAKYARLDQPYPLPDVPAASAGAADLAVTVLRGFGLDARTGGST